MNAIVRVIARVVAILWTPAVKHTAIEGAFAFASALVAAAEAYLTAQTTPDPTTAFAARIVIGFAWHVIREARKRATVIA